MYIPVVGLHVLSDLTRCLTAYKEEKQKGKKLKAKSILMP